MVPMHLGLIDKPFVPHYVKSAQYSPVPLPKIQMAPRLKILISSGSKKGTQKYFPFLSKVLTSESPPGPQQGPYGEIYPLTWHFYISLDMYIFISKALRKEHPSMFPKSGPLWKEIPISRALSTYPPESPTRKPSLQVLFTVLP
jgi:hypothetical protein